MNVKKYLRKEAQKTHQEILSADNGAFLEQLKITVENNKPPRKSIWKKWLAGTGCCILAAVIAIVCSVAFLHTNNTPVYLEENCVSEPTAYTHFNEEQKEFTLNIDTDIFSVNASRTYDKITGNLLYYTIILQSDKKAITADMVIICNRYYTHEIFMKANSDTQAELTGYTLIYRTETISDPDFDTKFFHASGEIFGDEIKIYIRNYDETLTTENEHFLSFVQDTIQKQ